ncbi:hypothetical protein [Dyadobacter sp. NIV53]|uniref:hypothetical protein n=1 Tax=Dyadobacter sp. NIV53 TaxID=2861765 RepID=UPI001C88BDC8|nr:hypothetical protein [Dyadobacter sp. NIV53]
MRNIFIIFLLFGFFSDKAYCQDSLNYKSKWQIRPSYGVNIPITKLLDGGIPDNMFKYGDNSTYWQVLSISYFFHKHWGLEFNFQGMTAGNISKRADNFLNAMKSDYEDNYYVTSSTSASYDDFNPFSGNFERGFIGLIYRYEKKRFFIYPNLSIGVSSFYTDWGNAILKQKNSNNLIEVTYDSGKQPNDHFILATSTAFGYKLSKRLFLNIDFMTSYYKTDITFIKKMTDLNTNISTSENIRYNKDIFTLSIGGGLIFVIR